MACPRLCFTIALAATLALGCAEGSIGEPRTGDPEVQVIPPDFLPAESALQRLTQEQYRRMIEDLFGEEIVVATSLEPDESLGGFLSIGASVSTISSSGVEKYEAAAFQIADQAMAPGPLRDALVPCVPSGTVDEVCARQVFTALGRRAWRRDMTMIELDETVAVSSAAATTLGDFHEGLEFGIAVILLSPHFIFRQELGEIDPSGETPLRFSSIEMASRLAFFLTNTGPDAELLAAGYTGALVDDDGLMAEASRLLASDGSRDAVRNFFTEMLRLNLLDELSKDPIVFEQMSAEVGPFAREETLGTIEALIFERDGDYRELLTTRETYLNRTLAAIYGVPTSAVGDAFEFTTMPENGPRAGLLGQLSILGLHSHPVNSSPTLRGKFVRTVLLCDEIPAPPANISTAIPEPAPGALTVRDRVEAHLEAPVCAGCHLQMDPIGLGLENYDALARWRDRDNGVLIDASGNIDGANYVGPAELGEVIAEHPDLGPCLVRQMYRYATGHVETPGETVVLRDLSDGFAESGYRVQDLMLSIVMSDGFRTSRGQDGYVPGGAP